MGKKEYLSDFKHGMVVGDRQAGLSISKTQLSLGFTENDPEKRKYPVSGSYVDKHVLLMSEVRGEWADWLEIIERQQ